LQQIQGKDDTAINEFDTDGIAVFIQDTQAWLIDHLINSCLIPLKDFLDISNKETLNRIQCGIKSVWQRLADKFEVSMPFCI
jgi:hypothetical protein